MFAKAGFGLHVYGLVAGLGVPGFGCGGACCGGFGGAGVGVAELAISSGVLMSMIVGVCAPGIEGGVRLLGLDAGCPVEVASSFGCVVSNTCR